MQIGFTKWINKGEITKESSLLTDKDLTAHKSFLNFFTKGKIKAIVISQLAEVNDFDLRINGFRDVNSRAEQTSDVLSTSVSIGIGIAVKMLNSVSSVLVFAGNYLIFIDRDARGNPTHFCAYNIHALTHLETFKDYQSWDRSTFHFSDGKTVEFGAPNAMGLAGNPNKKILRQLGKRGLTFVSSMQKQ